MPSGKYLYLMSNQFKLWLLAGLVSGSLNVHAAGLVLPQQGLQQDLAWLNSRGVINLSLSTWPLSQEEITAALAAARPNGTADAQVLARVQRQLTLSKSRLIVEGRSSTGFDGLAQGLGQTETDQHRASVIGQTSGEHYDVRLQANVVGGEGVGRASHFTPAGSYAAVKFANQWLSFGQVPHWWGPGRQGSLVFGHSARPVTGLTLQRAEQAPFDSRWLSWVGRWQYQLFAGQLAQYEAVPQAKMIGMRLSMMPTDYLELGASRTMQWGGKGRPQSLSSLGKAFLGKGDNVYTTTDMQTEPGNQLGGLDFRVKLQPLLNVPVSVYGQYVGEDEAGYMPSKNTYLLGVDGAHALGENNLSWSLEAADTTTELGRNEGITYNHHIYQNGYYQQGAPLAYALGGDARSVTAQMALATPDWQRYKVKLMHAKVNPVADTEAKSQRSNNKLYPRADTLTGVELGWDKTFDSGLNLDAGVWYVNSQIKGNDAVGAGVKLSMPF